MRILIADDHPLYLGAVREHLERMFPEAAINTANDLARALAHLDDGREAYDLILLDYSMPGISGIAGVKAAVAAGGGTPVVVMSGVADPVDVGACIGAGAKGFVPKTLDGKIFASAIGVILAGGSYLPAEMISAPHHPGLPPEEDAKIMDIFTERERVIMEMVVEGKSNKEIARLLNLREVTIKVQLTRIYKKLGAKNRAQAATLMAQNRILP